MTGHECSSNHWLGNNNPDPMVCLGMIRERPTECNQYYFNHAGGGDGNCGCVTDLNSDCSSYQGHGVVNIMHYVGPEPPPTPISAAVCYQQRPLVATEGGHLASMGGEIDPEACKAKCDNTARCHSFAMCQVNAGCWMKDRADITMDSPTNVGTAESRKCSTYFKAPCDSIPSAVPSAASWIDLSGAVTSVSSAAHGGEASRVVASANPSSRWGDNTCSHTNDENTPWWKVELGGNYGVSKVLVLNRGDCCGERLNGFTVKVGDTECATNVQITQGQALEVPCIGTGSSVTISLPRHGILTLCEVKVFGYGTTAA